MLKKTVNKNNIHVLSFATSSNDLTNQQLLRHVISRNYITHEFRVIPHDEIKYVNIKLAKNI